MTNDERTKSIAVKIADYFGAFKARYDEAVDKKQQESKEIRTDIAFKEEGAEALSKDKRKISTAREKAQEAGCGTREMDEKIRDLEQKITSTKTEIDLLRKKEAAIAVPTSPDFKRIQFMVSVLAQNGYQEGIEVVGLEDCIQYIRVGSSPCKPGRGPRENLSIEVDDTCRPLKCSIGWDSKCIRSIGIKAKSNAFVRNVVPDSLSWLPSVPASTAGTVDKGNAQVLPDRLAFIDRKTARVFVPSTSSDNRLPDDMVVWLEPSLDRWIAAENAEVDLDKPYNEGSLMAHVRTQLVPLMNNEPLYRPCDERLQSIKIYERIKTHWDALCTVPWSEDLRGVLALLKYYVENGEKARFWNTKIENAFGFRLRTRDHDWLVGEIYICNDEKRCGATGNPVEAYRVGESAMVSTLRPRVADGADPDTFRTARFGQMFLCVWREKSK